MDGQTEYIDARAQRRPDFCPHARDDPNIFHIDMTARGFTSISASSTVPQDRN
jgi:hypothetical protein